jgi:alpha-glucosidase (family GH31 glycosyl hydrolase)
MLLRWLQFGAFSPILRTHCSPTCDRYVWTFYRCRGRGGHTHRIK